MSRPSVATLAAAWKPATDGSELPASTAPRKRKIADGFSLFNLSQKNIVRVFLFRLEDDRHAEKATGLPGWVVRSTLLRHNLGPGTELLAEQAE